MKNQNDESVEGATLNLAIANVLFYVLTVAVGGSLIVTGDLAIILFGFSYVTFFGGLIWTPITSMFAHSSIAHLGGNMIFLLIYGFGIEERGYADTAIYMTYLVTGLLASLLSGLIFVLLGISSISVGASGAVFGLLGATAGIEKRERSGNYRSILLASVILFFLSSISPNTNFLAHLFGLLFGFFMGYSEWFDQYKE